MRPLPRKECSRLAWLINALLSCGMPKIKHFECSRCGATVSAAQPQTACAKGAGSLYVRYDLRAMRGEAGRAEDLRDASQRERVAREARNRNSALASAWAGMWRSRSVLPVLESGTLGAWWRPVIRSRR